MKDVILGKLSEEELAQILREHKMISQALGFSVGIHAKGDQSIEKKSTYTDEIETGPTAVMVKSQNKDIIFSFLRVSAIYTKNSFSLKMITCCY